MIKDVITAFTQLYIPPRSWRIVLLLIRPLP